MLDRCTFPAAGVAAVSGGADSLAMLALAVEAGVRVVEAVHVDHGLRPGSADEADVVRDVAGELGVPFRAERVVVERGPNLEARARAARFAAIGGDPMTGHTADDQAESVLLNLLRGAGVAGIGAMQPGPTKPILSVRRAETRALCVARGWTPVADPSNEDPAFRRNRIRHEVLPLLDRIAERDVAALLARSASLAGDDDALLEELAGELDVTDARGLAAAPAPLARRAVRRWLAVDGYPPGAATVERVLAVARGAARACDVGAGRSVRRSAQRLVLFEP
jgi:tRNA(Ile)-lysidine synthase